MSENHSALPEPPSLCSLGPIHTESQGSRVKIDFNGLSNLVFLQRKVTGKKIIAEASWLLSSRAEAGSLELHQLPCMASSLLFFSCACLWLFAYSILSLVLHHLLVVGGG